MEHISGSSSSFACEGGSWAEQSHGQLDNGQKDEKKKDLGRQRGGFCVQQFPKKIWICT